ncbi:MAG TPA: TetR/AcrR family transcriptional regulator [Polyangiaceae bacterium]
MALERFFRLSEARRNAILLKAAEAFAEQGYEGTSFNALLKTLKLSKSQAYYYFADKADLFVTACAACYEEYYAEVGRLPEPRDAEEFWSMVRDLCRIGVRFQRTHPIAARLSRALAESPRREELGRASINQAASTTERHTAWVQLGQRLGAVRTDLPLELLVALSVDISATTDVWFAARAEHTAESELEPIADQFADLSRRLFAPVPEASYQAGAVRKHRRRS